MKIEESKFTITASRKELLALQAALKHLNSLMRVHPDHMSGYNLNSRDLVDAMGERINEAVKP